MKPLTCAATRRRLQAFHDGELSVSEQIAVEGHIDWCDVCAEALADIRLIGSSLRLGAVGLGSMSHDEAVMLTATVVSRTKAERDASLLARISRVFDDMHLVYAGVGATVATVVCVVIIMGLMRFGTAERPDSLAAIMDLLAMPGLSANTIVIDAASHQRGTARFQAASASAEEDTVFALATMVTRDGRLANIHRLRTARGKATRDEAELIEGLLDAVTRARIEPTSIDGTRAVANSMVWLVTRTTVRATKILGIDLPLPPAKKHTARLTDPPVSSPV
jgi:anti-sigma factor RsiW